MDSQTVKPFKTIKEQIDLLKSRGLIIDDEVFAEYILTNINYYRFSAYTLSYKSGDKFYSGITFENIYSLYLFDKKLRLLLLEVLENIEIAFRTHIAYFHASTYGELGYKNPDNFKELMIYNKFIATLKAEIGQSKEIFIRDHKERNKEIPFWVAIEVLTFGSISKLFNNLLIPEKKEISKIYKRPYSYISSWLYSLSSLRNICAHYGRIYNRKLPIRPKIFKTDMDKFKIDTEVNYLYTYIILIKALVDDKVWRPFCIDLENLIDAYDNEIKLKYIGFPDNWNELLR